MLKFITNILLVVLLINFSSAANTRWQKSQGVANINCPLDDDPDDPTVLPIQGDCTRFLKCSYGLAYKLDCPSGLHWSLALSRCEAPKVAMCDPTKVTSPPVIGGKDCQFKFSPHSTDCSKFIQCVDGKNIELSCPPGANWDRFNEKCSFADDVLCI